MSQREEHDTRKQHRAPEEPAPWWLAVTMVVLSLVLALWLTSRLLVPVTRDVSMQSPAFESRDDDADVGHAHALVTLEATVGDITVSRALVQPHLALAPGEAVDVRLPAGSITGRVRIDPVALEQFTGHLGVQVAGGDATLMIDEKPTTVRASSKHIDTPDVALSSATYDIDAIRSITIDFHASGEGFALNLIHQPLGARRWHPMPVNNDNWPDAVAAARGMALIRSHNCLRCHSTSREGIRRMLGSREDDAVLTIDHTLTRASLARWISSPVSVRHDATMPSFPALDDQTTVDLVHYLVSKRSEGRTTRVPPERAIHPDLSERGLLRYAEIGCVACHADVALTVDPAYRSLFTPIPPQRERRSMHALADYLYRSSPTDRAAHSPALGLSRFEADALAVYLFSATDLAHADDTPQLEATFASDETRAARGRDAFLKFGCHACHASDAPASALSVSHTLADAPSFDQIIDMTERAGCLAPTSGAPTHPVRFTMNRAERGAINALLNQLQHARSFTVPIDEGLAKMIRYDCLSCHEFAGAGGPPLVVEASFQSRDPALADQWARMPPPLDFAGLNLSTDALQDGVTGEAHIRSMLATRMPKYNSADVMSVAAALQRLAGHTGTTSEVRHDDDALLSEQARLFTDVADDCVRCHAVDDRPAHARAPSLDALLGRMRSSAFARAAFDHRFATRASDVPESFDERTASGASDEQLIRALRAYVARVAKVRKTTGGERDSIVEVEDQPVVIHAFARGTDRRVVGVGFPAGVHLAFDLVSAQPRATWLGAFYPSGGVLTATPDMSSVPDVSVWAPPRGPTVISGDEPILGWQLGGPETGVVSYTGYSIDRSGVPTFHWHLRRGSEHVDVDERIVPVSDGSAIERAIRFQSSDVNHVWFNAGAGARVTVNGREQPIVRPDGLIRVALRDEVGLVLMRAPLGTTSGDVDKGDG